MVARSSYAGTLGKGDPYLGDENPLQVQAGQFHVSVSSVGKRLVVLDSLRDGVH